MVSTVKERRNYTMKYVSAALIVLGLSISIGAEAHDWFPMFVAQIALGMTVSFSGVLFATQIDFDNDDN